MDDVAWSARANLEQPDAVQRVHEEYIRAGAEVIIANTYAASRAALEPAGQAASGGGQPARSPRRPAGPRGRGRAGGGGRLDVVVLPERHDARVPGPAARGPGRRGSAVSPPGRLPGAGALLAEEGVDLIALEMINARGYGRAAVQAAAETGLPVWLGVSPFRRDDGTLIALPEQGDGDRLEDLLTALADPALAAVTVMHAKPEVTLDAIDIIRRCFAGPVGVYAETGDWVPPNWVFDGLDPDEYLRHAITWADHGAQLIGGCCGVGPGHIRALAGGLPRRG